MEYFQFSLANSDARKAVLFPSGLLIAQRAGEIVCYKALSELGQSAASPAKKRSWISCSMLFCESAVALRLNRQPSRR